MAYIDDLAKTGEDLPTLLRAMDEHQLAAQQIVQQGAIHALQTLLKAGATPENAQDMLDSCNRNKAVIEGIAREKGWLIDFNEPGAHDG